MYLKHFKLLRFPLAEMISMGLRDPYLIFQKVAEDSFSVSKEILIFVEDLKKEEIKKVSYSKLIHKMDQFPFYGFVNHYNLYDPEQYVSTYCGLKSHPEDLSQVRDCLMILRRSKSLLEFLKGLESSPGRLPQSKSHKYLPKARGWSRTPKKITKRSKEIRQNILFKKSHIVDPGNLRSDRLVYEFFVDYLIDMKLLVDAARTELCRRNSSFRGEIGWIPHNQTLYFDTELRNISSKQCIRVASAYYFSRTLGGYQRGTPLTTTFIHTLSNQLLVYLEIVGKSKTSTYKNKAFRLFKDSFLYEYKLRLSLLNECQKMKAGQCVNVDSILKKTITPKTKTLLKARRINWASREVQSVVSLCGATSTAEDQLNVRNYFHLIENSKSMMELIDSLGHPKKLIQIAA